MKLGLYGGYVVQLVVQVGESRRPKEAQNEHD